MFLIYKACLDPGYCAKVVPNKPGTCEIIQQSQHLASCVQAKTATTSHTKPTFFLVSHAIRWAFPIAVRKIPVDQFHRTQGYDNFYCHFSITLNCRVAFTGHSTLLSTHQCLEMPSDSIRPVFGGHKKVHCRTAGFWGCLRKPPVD